MPIPIRLREHFLRYVSLNTGLITVGSETFYSCDVSTIVVPNTVTTTKSYAFGGNENMTLAFIPLSVTTMEANVFYHCYSATIYCVAESQPTTWNNRWNPSNYHIMWGFEI